MAKRWLFKAAFDAMVNIAEANIVSETTFILRIAYDTRKTKT